MVPSWITGFGLYLLLALLATPASATFHLNEITKLMVGFDGDSTNQAVEFRMLASGENHVQATLIDTYDLDGVILATLGRFTDSLPVGVAGRRFLCATTKFATTFGITPDLVIAPGIPLNTGQVAFEKDPNGVTLCLVNALPYGAVLSPLGSSSSAPALAGDGAKVLIRVIDDAGTPSCPLAEDANARFHITWGTSAQPVPFTNNAGVTANVFSTITGVESDIRGGLGQPRVYPNPAFSGATIEWPGVPLTFVSIYDVSGRRVRVWGSPNQRAVTGGPARILWDGTNGSGRPLPSGVYFIRIGAQARRVPVVLLR